MGSADSQNIEDTLEKENSVKEKEKHYRALKLKLEGYRKKRKLPICIGLVITFLFSTTFYVHMLEKYSYEYGNVMTLIISIFMGLFAGIITAIYMSICLDVMENRTKRRMLDYEVENVQDKIDEDVFENSIKMSYKYLDQYYYQTREQAQKGFFVTVCISIFGAILIGAGITAMFLGKVQPSYITCASGIATEFISAIFFYLYNKTISSMSKYHNKLVLSQNISIALKVADTLPSDDKIKAKNVIIQELLKNVNSHLTKSDDENKKK